MNIKKLANGALVATLPCGKMFSGMDEEGLIEHCQDWQKRQNELKSECESMDTKQAIKDSIMPKVTKSLLFTAYYVNGKLTCVRCNITGRFVKRGIYLAIQESYTLSNGVITDFNAVSLFDAITSDNYINVLNVLSLALLSVFTTSLINLFL